MYLESIKQEETKLVKTQDDLQAHKDKAQAALDYYRQLITETEVHYQQICSLRERSGLTPSEKANLRKLKKNYSAFISADYMMSKKPTLLGRISAAWQNILPHETCL